MIKMVEIGVMKLGESAGLKIVGISGWRNGTRLSLLQRRTLGGIDGFAYALIDFGSESALLREYVFFFLS